MNLITLTENPNITDICINNSQLIFIDQGQGMEKYNGPPLFETENEYKTFVLEQISKSGKTWDAKHPFLDTVFFGTHRAHISFPPLAQFGIYLSLRKLPTKQKLALPTLKENAFTRWRSSFHLFDKLLESIALKETILFAGGTGTGKTTLLNDLLLFTNPHERMIALEDTPEIYPQMEHFLSLTTRQANADGYGIVTLKDLVKQTLRMRPDRILIGECRGDEVLDLLQALNTGHTGTLSTIHANSARDALKRLELLALIASKGSISHILIKELIAKGIQKIAFLKRDQNIRKIDSILEITGFERDIIFSNLTSNVQSNHSLVLEK